MKYGLHRLGLDETRFIDIVSAKQKRICLSEDLGHCYVDALQIEEGLQINQLHYCPKYQLLEETQSTHQQPVMVLTVGLQGHSEYQSRNTENINFQAGYITINTFTSVEGIRHYQQQETVAQLRLIMTPQFLSKYLNEEQVQTLFYPEHINQIAFNPISATSKVHALALVHSLQQARRDPQHLLQQHIHALSILSDQLGNIAPQPQSFDDNGLNYKDIQNLEKAKTMMINQIDQGLTINVIANLVGMNVHKFKVSFIKLYGINPTEYLLEIRMRKALALLDSGLQVAQVAWQVGYKYPNNFTVAFTRFYGKSPKAMFSHKV